MLQGNLKFGGEKVFQLDFSLKNSCDIYFFKLKTNSDEQLENEMLLSTY